MVSKEPALHGKGFGANQRSFLVPARESEIELLEQGVGSATDVQLNLNEMWRLNRYFGGIKTLTSYLYPLLCQHGNNLRVVDLGTGSGEIPLHIARWAQQRRLTIEF